MFCYLSIFVNVKAVVVVFVLNSVVPGHLPHGIHKSGRSDIKIKILKHTNLDYDSDFVVK